MAKQNHRVSRFKRLLVCQRDGYRCRYCGELGTIETLTTDHVLPAKLFDSGIQANRMSNLAAACVPCNNSKGDNVLLGPEYVLALDLYTTDPLPMRHFGRIGLRASIGEILEARK